MLCAHITTDGDKQYLNLLLSGGEGPVTNIKDITIDGNPLANYDDVEVNLRYGTNDQAVIPNFADSYADQSLSYKLTTDDYATQRIDGNATEGIELTFEFPSGLFRSNDDGGLEETSVTIGMEYRKYGAADWLSFKTGSLKVTGSSSSAIRRVVRVDNLAQGQYEVRCKILNQDGTTNRYINTCYWTVVSSIVYDDFSYPNMVLVGIQALATDKLSGSSPNVTWKHTRAVVQVWNPNTASYEEKPATNAAWACYDLTHCCRKLKNINTGSYEYLVEGAPAGLILYDDFLAWASACDSRGLVCNYILDASGDMDAAWKPFEAAGRGKVVRRGTRYGCIYDHAADPVQMFSVGNIRSGTFSLDYLPIDDRANCVEITYNNEDKDHERDSMMVYGEDYDESNSVDNPTQITLDAITDPDAIYQEGKYYLRKNKYLIRTCTFEADVDAIASQVGDNILVQHDIPQWGFGGRLKGFKEGVDNLSAGGAYAVNPEITITYIGIENGYKKYSLSGVWAHGGGGADACKDKEVPVTPGTTYQVTIGAGGNGGSNSGNAGTATSFGPLLTLPGGGAGLRNAAGEAGGLGGAKGSVDGGGSMFGAGGNADGGRGGLYGAGGAGAAGTGGKGSQGFLTIKW